jgi:hypothetical protein
MAFRSLPSTKSVEGLRLLQLLQRSLWLVLQQPRKRGRRIAHQMATLSTEANCCLLLHHWPAPVARLYVASPVLQL